MAELASDRRRPRVFLSYARDRPGDAARDVLEQSLDTAGFEPWRGVEDAEEPQAARDRFLESSLAAVVIMSPRAIAWDWTSTEVELLLARNASDPAFTLVALGVGDIDREQDGPYTRLAAFEVPERENLRVQVEQVVQRLTSLLADDGAPALLSPSAGPEPSFAAVAGAAIVRIDRADRSAVVGAGVVVVGSLVLTGSHVIADALGLPDNHAEAPRDEVRLHLPSRDIDAVGYVDAWFADEPFVATVDMNVVLEVTPRARLRAPQLGSRVWMHGFPAGDGRGQWASARIQDTASGGLLQLETGPDGLDPGFGGAAVWDEDGALVGIVTGGHSWRPVAHMASSPMIVAAIPRLPSIDPVARPATGEPEPLQTGGEPPPRAAARDAFPAAPPSARVHADKWTTEDSLDYALYATAIAEFIKHPDATPPMVISVQAPWGQGKTSLMRMVQSNLDADHPDLRAPRRRDAAEDPAEPTSELTFGDLQDSLDGSVPLRATKPRTIRSVWFNAWKYQSSEQVWAGLAHAILSQLPARLSARDRELFWLKLQLRRIDPSAVRNDIHRAALERFLPRLAGGLVAMLGVVIVAGLSALAGGLGAIGAAGAGGGVLGLVVLARRAWTKATKDVLHRPLEGAYLRYVRQPEYATRLGYLHLVEEDMVRALDLLTPDDDPAVIFIDDLDRCSPTKIGEVLEAVNLFLAGDYPNCAFVIGIDAEVVAASMEVVHEQVIEKLGDRHGELGWRFMDKFVQLPFVMPRLHPDQRSAYLRGLLWTPRPQEPGELVDRAARLESDIRENALPVDESARRVGELAPQLAAVAPDRARALGQEVVAAGAREFSDNDPEVVDALAAQMRYLSDNPRAIKRAVNLYRFHRFAAFARQASALPLEVATPEQIGRWVVPIVRWPHFVRWLQTQRDGTSSEGEDAVARVIALAAAATSLEEFRHALEGDGIDAAWTREHELWEYLREEATPDLQLALAASRGMW